MAGGSVGTGGAPAMVFETGHVGAAPTTVAFALVTPSRTRAHAARAGITLMLFIVRPPHSGLGRGVGSRSGVTRQATFVWGRSVAIVKRSSVISSTTVA